jgi:hypothetical protein
VTLWSEERTVEGYKEIGFKALGKTLPKDSGVLHEMGLQLLYSLPATEPPGLALDMGSPFRHDYATDGLDGHPPLDAGPP